MGLVWLVSLQFGQKFNNLFKNRAAGLMLFYYLVLAVSGIFTPLPAEGGEELLLKFPFLAWAIMLGSVTRLRENQIWFVIKAFVMATAVSVVYCFADSLYSYMAFPHSSVFYFEELVNFSLIPPHYLGLFVNFSYALVFQSLLSKRKLLASKKFSIALLMLFFIAVVFISVRMQFVVFVIINGVVIFNYLRAKRGTLWAALSFLGLVLVFLGIALVVPGSKARIIDTYHELRSFDGMVDNKQTNPRVFLWSGAMEVIEENFWTGTGTGAEGPALDEKLSKQEIIYWDGTQTYFLHQAGHNYHNVYLQHFAAMGVAGFIALLLFFLWPLLARTKNALGPQAMLFLLVCFLSFISESMLQRQAGVLFFSFFWALFFVLKPQSNQEGKKNV